MTTHKAGSQLPKSNPLPSIAFLSEHFLCDPVNGRLFWKKGKRAGKEAGAPQNGYKSIQVTKDGKRFNLKAHRVIWKMVHGTEPDEIDHINGARSDNRIENLRSVSCSSNQKNKSRQKGSKAPFQGVNWYPNSNRWHARIGANGKIKNLGYFHCLGLAVSARKEAEAALNYHPNHGRS
jgi:hypothetical protein